MRSFTIIAIALAAAGCSGSDTYVYETHNHYTLEESGDGPLITYTDVADTGEPVVCEFEEVVTGNGRVILDNKLEFTATGNTSFAHSDLAFRKVAEFNVTSLYSECGLMPLRMLPFNIHTVGWGDELNGDSAYVVIDDIPRMEGVIKTWEPGYSGVWIRGNLNIEAGENTVIELWMDTSEAPEDAALQIELDVDPVGIYVNTGTWEGEATYYPYIGGDPTIPSEWIYF